VSFREIENIRLELQALPEDAPLRKTIEAELAELEVRLREVLEHPERLVARMMKRGRA
jgi:hypothetical protein